MNALYVQPFVNYNLGKGLAIGTMAEATANWKAKEVWSAPMLFTVSRIAMPGKRPVNILMGAGPYVLIVGDHGCRGLPRQHSERSRMSQPLPSENGLDPPLK